MKSKPVKEASLGIALIPICFLIVMLIFSLRFEGQDPHIPIFCSAMLAAFIGVFVLHHQWKQIIHTISLSMQAILILLIIGMVIGTWILSGVVPSMIHLGLQMISPGIFLPATLIISFIFHPSCCWSP